MDATYHGGRAGFIPFIVILASCITSSAHARLESRLGGQAYYDTEQNLLWLANVNLPKTESFGIGNPGGSDGTGRMRFDTALGWIAAMNSANHLGFNDWRLPIVTDTGSLGCSFSYSGSDCGYNLDPDSSEIAHMYFSTLRNVSTADETSRSRSEHPRYRNPDMRPFMNADVQTGHYWATPDRRVTFNDQRTWQFNLRLGDQRETDVNNLGFIWPVRTGDVTVPSPYDSDRDGVTDPNDAFPHDAAASVDTDGDGHPDDWNTAASINLRQASALFLDPDDDDDGVPDATDNCRVAVNADQADLDIDAIGDACDTDVDGDGVPNAYELAHAMDPRNAADAALDFDGDGLSNLEEFRHRANANSRDSDGDGFEDGEEVALGRSPAVNEAVLVNFLFDNLL